MNFFLYLVSITKQPYEKFHGGNLMDDSQRDNLEESNFNRKSSPADRCVTHKKRSSPRAAIKMAHRFLANRLMPSFHRLRRQCGDQAKRGMIISSCGDAEDCAKLGDFNEAHFDEDLDCDTMNPIGLGYRRDQF